jgi:hypothetical protein
MKDVSASNDVPASPVEPGYVLQVGDRTSAAMQLAAHFTAESMRLSSSDDPRTRLAEQLSYFDLAFRSIMSSTARAMIRSGTQPISADGENRSRPVTSEFRIG